MVFKESIQTSFLEQIKKGLKPTVTFADDLAEVLNVSRDSAYRRIRGETVLSLDEVKVLYGHYGVSLDDFLSPPAERVSFQLTALTPESFSLQKWLTNIMVHLSALAAFPDEEKHLVFDAKDLPIFHFFQFPRLAAFKLYLWGRFFSHEAKFDSGKYNQALVGNELISLGEKIWHKYSLIPSIEIIRHEMLTGTIRQIKYLHECGLFEDENEAMNLCDDCFQLVAHLKDQAQQGLKKTFATKTVGGKFGLYHNDLLIGDNTILFKMGEKRIAFVTPNNFNILMTAHPPFCKLTEDHINNLIDKSILISATGEKERNKFFNKVEKGIQKAREKVSLIS